MAKLALSNTTSSLSEIFDDPGFGLADDIFSVLENLDNFDDFCGDIHKTDEEAEMQNCKRQKIVGSVEDTTASFGEQKNISHITVERNRRKQMNEHLTVLRSLMPCFYVKRGDQASIIGGVVDYIKELQQVLNSLEARKHRKSYNIEVLSPRLISSPRVLPLSPLSPKKPPLSPRVNLPISPRTPTSPYKPLMIPQVYHFSPTIHDLSPSLSSPSTTNSTIDNVNELVANSKSGNADVEVKFYGPNVLLKTVSGKIPGQALKIVSAIEEMSLEILNVSIGTIDETMVNSFTIKIGIECELSAEDLAHRIQQTFC